MVIRVLKRHWEVVLLLLIALLQCLSGHALGSVDDRSSNDVLVSALAMILVGCFSARGSCSVAGSDGLSCLLLGRCVPLLSTQMIA